MEVPRGPQRSHPSPSLEVDPEDSDQLWGWWSTETSSSFPHWDCARSFGCPGPTWLPECGGGGAGGLAPPPCVQAMRLWGARAWRRPYLHHVHEVAEAHGLVDGQVAVAVQHAVVDDVTAEADAQHVVAGVPRRLAHQEQPVLGRLQLLHGLLAGDLPVEPPAAGGGARWARLAPPSFRPPRGVPRLTA